MSYANSLVAALRAAVASKISSAPKTPGRNGKGKKRSKTAALEDAPTLPAPTAAQAPKQPNWGMLDPIRPLVPFADTIDMLFTPQVVITVLAALLIYAWFFRAGGPAATGGPGGAAARPSARRRFHSSCQARSRAVTRPCIRASSSTVSARRCGIWN